MIKVIVGYHRYSHHVATIASIDIVEFSIHVLNINSLEDNGKDERPLTSAVFGRNQLKKCFSNRPIRI